MSVQNKLIKAMMDQEVDWLKAERERLNLERERLALERAKQETATLAKPKIFNMVSPMRFCSGTKELDKFLDALWSNFNSHKCITQSLFSIYGVTIAILSSGRLQ